MRGAANGLVFLRERRACLNTAVASVCTVERERRARLCHGSRPELCAPRDAGSPSPRSGVSRKTTCRVGSRKTRHHPHRTLRAHAHTRTLSRQTHPLNRRPRRACSECNPTKLASRRVATDTASEPLPPQQVNATVMTPHWPRLEARGSPWECPCRLRGEKKKKKERRNKRRNEATRKGTTSDAQAERQGRQRGR